MFRHQDNVTFRMATVSGVDVAGRKIHLEDSNQIAYDYLVLAGGATVNYFNTPGAAEHAFPLYTLMNAVKLRNQILDRFEAADRNPSLIEDGALNFVIVGAGPTGVETAGALADLFYNLLASRLPSARHRKGAGHHCRDGERGARPVQRESAYVRKR